MKKVINLKDRGEEALERDKREKRNDNYIYSLKNVFKVIIKRGEGN